MKSLFFDSLRDWILDYQRPNFSNVTSYFANNAMCNSEIRSMATGEINIDAITPNNTHQKSAYIITGGIASGKSTIAYSLINYLGIETLPYLSSDTFYKAFFSENPSFEDGYNMARKLTDSLLDKYIERNASFIWETLFSKKKKEEYIRKLKKEKYNIICIYISVDSIDEQITRASERSRFGYHQVSSEFIVDRNNLNLESVNWLFPSCDKICVINNHDNLSLSAYLDDSILFINKSQIDPLIRRVLLNDALC